MAAASALPGGDPGDSSLWLPSSEELVPPKGIINSAQLERELVHMFSNAIMYNPDPFRGPGPAFMPSEDDEGDDEGGTNENALGYKVDENGVVKDTYAMFRETEKLLSELRAAEIQRGGRPAPALGGMATGTSTRNASVAAGHAETPVGRDNVVSTVGEDVDEPANTEPENVGNTAKKRRTTRGKGGTE
jgi:hypothetical protein